MKKDIQTYYVTFDEDRDESGMNLISIVNDPAIEEFSIRLSKNDKEKELKFSFIEEKKMIVGPAIIPNKVIPRYDEENDEYFNIVFEKDTIEKMVKHFNKKAIKERFNFEHSDKIISATLKGSWIIEDEQYDKSKMYGFKNLPIGTYFIEVQIENDEDWELVKEMDNTGFSIEAMLKLVEKDIKENLNNNKKNKIEMKLTEKFEDGKLLIFNGEELIKTIDLSDYKEKEEMESEKEEMEVVETEDEKVETEKEDKEEMESEDEKESKEEMEEESNEEGEEEKDEVKETINHLISKIAELEARIDEMVANKEDEEVEENFNKSKITETNDIFTSAMSLINKK